MVSTRYKIQKCKIKRIYTDGTGWIDIKEDIVVNYFYGEDFYLETWIINNNWSILRKSITVIEWDYIIRQSEREQMEEIK